MAGWVNLTETITETQQQEVIAQAVSNLRGLPLNVTRNRQALQPYARQAVQRVMVEKGYTAPAALVEALVRKVASEVGGMGFLDELLPPNRTDLVEIALNPDGAVWVMPKGSQAWVKLDYRPTVEEAWRAVEALLGATGHALTEAEPTVDAKLPRFADMGGARVKAIHPIITPGLGYPSLNIRLFEPKPVLPEQIVAWKMAPSFVMDTLLEAVAKRSRVLVIGGTSMGKTTFLSALANGGIPKDARVVKIEDPEEIWLDHPNVVTLEARHAPVGSRIAPYTVRDGVDDALRMAPQWLIVGEVRTGSAVLSLFRAQMSDHPGLSTFHADSPDKAVLRMGAILHADAQVKTAAAKMLFAEAVDVVVQVGMARGLRRVIGVWEVEGIKGGDVRFRTLYRLDDEEMQPVTRTREWQKE